MATVMSLVSLVVFVGKQPSLHTTASDHGNHAVAAEVSEEFLTFSASRGNDLRSIGLKGGCKWCLCVSRYFINRLQALDQQLTILFRWREAFDARKDDNDAIVPRYVLPLWSMEGIMHQLAHDNHDAESS